MNPDWHRPCIASTGTGSDASKLEMVQRHLLEVLRAGSCAAGVAVHLQAAITVLDLNGTCGVSREIDILCRYVLALERLCCLLRSTYLAGHQQTKSVVLSYLAGIMTGGA